MLHLGAFTATITTANVTMIIMSNYRVVAANLKAARLSDTEYGKISKMRPTLNNYLTLPVIFLVLLNYYQPSFATLYA